MSKALVTLIIFNCPIHLLWVRKIAGPFSHRRISVAASKLRNAAVKCCNFSRGIKIKLLKLVLNLKDTFAVVIV